MPVISTIRDEAQVPPGISPAGNSDAEPVTTPIVPPIIMLFVIVSAFYFALIRE